MSAASPIPAPPSATPPRRSARVRVAALIAANAALLAALLFMRFGPVAQAQTRPRGDYAMVAGDAKGSDAQVIWVLDQVHEELVAVAWNASRQELVGVGFRSLAADAVGVSRGRN